MPAAAKTTEPARVTDFIATAARVGSAGTLTISELSYIALEPYRDYLDRHTADATDPSLFGGAVASRYESLRFCFERFLSTGGRTVVELGTIRSFVHGGLPGCNADDPGLWEADNPERWDWGAGAFSLLAAICLREVAPRIHTVDVVPGHIARCQVVTAPYKELFAYHVSDSVEFLRSLPRRSVDLLYLDTGDMWPIERSAQHQLSEAKALVRRQVLSDHGVVLIDDVRNSTPLRHGESSHLGKSKYALPYLQANGYRVVFDGYQVALEREAPLARRRSLWLARARTR